MTREFFEIGGAGTYEIGDDDYNFIAGPYQEIGSYNMIYGEYGPEKWSAGAANFSGRNAALARRQAQASPMAQAVAQKMAQSGTIVREKEPTKSRQYAIPFDSGGTVAAGATSNLTSSPQVLFRPERIVIGGAIAQSFVLNDFKVGKNSQFATSGSHPGDAFAPNAFGVRLKCDTAQVSHLITMNVTNISAGALRFLATVFGEAVE